ncbi:MAG: fibronectin type III domain-containing protein [Ignavibacteriales bacterium]|nr:fibronectin type III domain-containing protein [Ignavibacteriales bacterium]
MKIKNLLLTFVSLIFLTINYVSAQPAPITPTSGAPGVSLTPSFTWQDYAPPGNNYDWSIWTDVYTNPGATMLDIKTNITNSTTYGGATALTNNTTYYWYVQDHVTPTLYGPYTFTTIVATPSLLTPGVAAAGVAVSGTNLIWDPLAANTAGVTLNVQYQVNGAGAWTDVPFADPTTTSCLLPILLYNTQYNWQVQAIGPNETTTSIPRSFTTLMLPAPALTTPATTLSGISILPYFEWTWSGFGAVTYDLTIYESDGISVVTTKTIITEKHYQFLETDFVLSNNHNYKWKVTVRQGTNERSSTLSEFKTTVSAVASLSNPGSGIVYTYAPVFFSWYLSTSVGSLTFELQYVKDAASSGTPDASDWANVAITTTVPCNSDLTNNDQTLDSGTKYWWRIITFRDGEVVSYATARSFTTSGGATIAKAIPSWPIGGAGTKVYTNTPTFYWYTNSGDLTDISFDLLIDQHSGDLDVGSEVHVVNISDLSYTLDGTAGQLLLPGTVYYWKVKTYYKRGVVGIERTYTPTAYASFKTNGEGTVLTPILSYPTGSVTVYTETPTLYWYLGGLSDGLTFEVSINGQFYTTTDLYLDLSTVTTSAGLTGGGIYSWTVRAYNGSGGTITSAPASFKIAGGTTQGKPIASWPIGNHPTVYTTTPTLYWYVSGSTLGLDGYRVAWSQATIAPNAAWSAVVTYENITDLSQMSCNTFTGNYGESWHWAVASYIGGSFSTWSTGEFTIAGTTGSIVPVASYPKGGVTIYSISATLSWYVNGSTTGIDHYRVVYSRRSDMDESDVTNTFHAEPTDQYLDVTDLVPGATYYWKVASHNGTGLSAYSNPTAIFVVAPTASASVVVPLVGSPNHGVGIPTTSPMLSWVIPTQTSTQLNYEIQYSKQQDMSDAITVNGIKSPSQIVSDLSANQEYYWRVRSVNDKGEASAYSEAGKFVVSSVTAVEDKEVIPTKFNLSQNYPNPFNPATTIRFALPEASPVIVKIFNILGKEVKTLVNENMQAGNHLVVWNGDDESGKTLPSGTYIYRITAGNNSQNRKMVLLK